MIATERNQLLETVFSGKELTMKGRNPKRHENHKHHEPEDERREHARGTGYGREQTIYLEYMARRWQGSESPSPQLYSRALKQLRQLPGSVVTAATDLGTLPPAPPPPHSNHPHRRRENGGKS
jgi:hypothetical protein